MTTAFPIAEANPRLQPGVYVLAAHASLKKEDEGYRNAATQWLPLVATLVLQPLLKRWGVGAALFMLPAAMLTTNAVVGIWGGLVAVATAKATQSTLQNSAERTGREIVYMPVPAAIKARGKPLIDVGVDSAAKALSAGVIFLVLAALGPGALAWTAAGLSVAWLVLAWALRRGYVRALARAIATRDTTLDVLAASLSANADLSQVQSELLDGDPDRAAFALDLLAQRTFPGVANGNVERHRGCRNHQGEGSHQLQEDAVPHFGASKR